jgi:dethiobiotin synthetase/adenosylmethionine--8-amino-7-oxononanoate aminotransferase
MHLKRQMIMFSLDLQLWDNALVKQLSSLPNVKRVVSIGTLCAIELKAEGLDSGYVSYESL